MELMAEICHQSGYSDSTAYNNDLNECLKIMVTTSDDFKAGRADAYELVAKLEMHKRNMDKFFRGVP